MCRCVQVLVAAAFPDGRASRRRAFCHFADTPSPSIMKHLLGGVGDCSRMTEPSPTAQAGPSGRSSHSSTRTPAPPLLPWRHKVPSGLSGDVCHPFHVI